MEDPRSHRLPRNLAFALQVSTVLLLVLALWRFEAFGAMLGAMNERNDQRLSGQFVESHGVRTERYVDEPMRAWKARHLEAIDELGDQDGRDG